MLGRLRLELSSGRYVRDKSEMDEETVLASHLLAHLANRLEERQGFDIADGATDFDNRDVDGFGDTANGFLDFIRHMGNHLDSFSEVVSAAFLLNDGFVNATGGEIVAARQLRVCITLVVAEIEIGLSAIVGDVDLTVLIGTHRSGIDIQVRVELQQADLESTALQQTADGGGRQSLTQR